MTQIDPANVPAGGEQPSDEQTKPGQRGMIGTRLRSMYAAVLEEDVPGDLLKALEQLDVPRKERPGGR